MGGFSRERREGVGMTMPEEKARRSFTEDRRRRMRIGGCFSFIRVSSERVSSHRVRVGDLFLLGIWVTRLTAY